jgi:hypothetical protein
LATYLLLNLFPHLQIVKKYHLPQRVVIKTDLVEIQNDWLLMSSVHIGCSWFNCSGMCEGFLCAGCCSSSWV